MKKLVLSMGLAVCLFMGNTVLLNAETKTGISYGHSGSSFLAYIIKTDNWYYGLQGGLSNTTSTTDSSSSYIGAWIAKKDKIDESIEFNYGFDFSINMGKSNGADIENAYSLGPWFGYHYYLNESLFLSTWLYPIQFSTQEVNSVKTETTTFFKGGAGIGILF